MPDIPLVDTHVHLWDPRQLRYDWLEEVPQLHRPFLPDDYHQATAGLEIEAVIFVQCDCDRVQSLGEVRWVAQLARTEPQLQGIVAHAPLELGGACRTHLEHLAAIPLVRGVRRLIQSEPDVEFCLQPAFLEGLQLLANFDLSFDICVYHFQLENAIRMVQQVPEVQFILDHMGKPDIKRSVREPWASQLRQLASLSNVSCKMSGAITEANHQVWTRHDIQPYLDHVLDCFGVDRVHFGSDWPVVNLAGSYSRWIDTLDMFLADHTRDERRKILNANARRVYRLERPE